MHCMHAGMFVSPWCVCNTLRGCPGRFDPPSRSLAIFSFFLSFHYASMALFVEFTVLLVGSFHVCGSGADVALEFDQGVFALRG